MSQTLNEIYAGQYAALVQRRLHLIAEIEKLNHQIIQIIKEAKRENVDVVRISATS